MDAARISLQGDRSNNQDRCAIFYSGKSCFMVLADGLGGHPKGEVAAHIMLSVCEQMYAKTPKPISSPRFFFHHCVAHAHKLINQYGQSQTPIVAPRTTVVMALIQDGYCYWSYAGDSRFYLIRDNSIVLQSTDHSVAHRGSNGEENPGNRALTRCVGGQRSAPMPSTEPPFPLQPNDILLLCSDGLWGQLPGQQLVETLWNVFPLQKALHMLGSAAEKNAQTRSDNISALSVRVDASSCGVDAGAYTGDTENELLSAIDHLNTLITQNIPET
ncbi:PP2C family protein-serine/threonine phosphatase [Thiolapillus sp.]